MELLQLGELLAKLSPAGMLGVFVFMLLRGWIILPSALKQKEDELKKVEAQRDKFQDIALQALNIGERVTTVIESNGGKQ